MSEPLVVMIPHRLGKDEALRRIRDGLGRAKREFAMLLTGGRALGGRHAALLGQGHGAARARDDRRL